MAAKKLRAKNKAKKALLLRDVWKCATSRSCKGFFMSTKNCRSCRSPYGHDGVRLAFGGALGSVRLVRDSGFKAREEKDAGCLNRKAVETRRKDGQSQEVDEMTQTIEGRQGYQQISRAQTLNPKPPALNPYFTY